MLTIVDANTRIDEPDVNETVDLRLAGSWSDDPRWPQRRVEAWTWAFVVLGIVLRVTRYALRHPLWGDEAFLAYNFIDRDFVGLMKPLDYVQVCPLFFLWAEKLLVIVFGFSELTLRLIPTLASIAGLILFRHVASRLLRGPALPLAVAILAVGFYPIRHGGEIKPYSVDFLAALGLIGLAIEWLRRPDRDLSLWALCIAGPIAIGFSNPAIFVAASVGLVLLVPVFKTKRWPTILVLGFFGIGTLGTFLLLFLKVTGPQSASVMEPMSAYWVDSFPPRNIVTFAGWFIRVHVSQMFAYPAGGAGGASTLTTGLVLAAIVAYFRRGSRNVLALLLLPFAMGLIAASLGRYPYGGSARTMQYVAPSIILMAGLGGAVLLSRLRNPRTGDRAMGLSLSLLILVGVGLMGWDCTHPYKSIYDRESRDYAKRLWSKESTDAEIVCARNDLGVQLDPLGWRGDRAAIYLCHQAIYSPRHRDRLPLSMDRVSATKPLRAVVFAEKPEDQPGIDGWLELMKGEFELRDRKEVYVNRGKNSKAGYFEDRYVVYEFVPRNSLAKTRTATFR